MTIPPDTLVHLTPDGDIVPGARHEAPTLWPFTQHRRLPWRSRDPLRIDPINLFVLGTGPGALHELLQSAGWSRPDDGATHRTWVDGTFRTMVDHAALGDRQERVHARLFALSDGCLVAAHHEVMNDRGKHIVTSWDRARGAVGEALAAGGFLRLAPTPIVTPPDLRGVPSDGRIWRLVRT